jgi:hypothetical protein
VVQVVTKSLPNASIRRFESALLTYQCIALNGHFYSSFDLRSTPPVGSRVAFSGSSWFYVQACVKLRSPSIFLRSAGLSCAVYCLILTDSPIPPPATLIFTFEDQIQQLSLTSQCAQNHVWLFPQDVSELSSASPRIQAYRRVKAPLCLDCYIMIVTQRHVLSTSTRYSASKFSRVASSIDRLQSGVGDMGEYGFC